MKTITKTYGLLEKETDIPLHVIQIKIFLKKTLNKLKIFIQLYFEPFHSLKHQFTVMRLTTLHLL